MAKFLLNENLEPLYSDVDEPKSVSDFLTNLRIELRAADYTHLDTYDNVVSELQRGTRIAFVDGFETRLGAQMTVKDDSLIFTQGKGDQGN